MANGFEFNSEIPAFVINALKKQPPKRQDVMSPWLSYLKENPFVFSPTGRQSMTQALESLQKKLDTQYTFAKIAYDQEQLLSAERRREQAAKFSEAQRAAVFHAQQRARARGRLSPTISTSPSGVLGAPQTAGRSLIGY